MAEYSIDIKKLVKSAIMEEVNNLSVRAAVKDKLEEVSGLSKEDVRKLIMDVADSYIRSLDIQAMVDNAISNTIKQEINNAVKKALDEYFGYSYYGYCREPTKHLRELILDDLKNQFFEKFDLVVIDKKSLLVDKQ